MTNRRVLVIEDNPLNLELLEYTLRAFGWEPVSATRGQEGLALARRQRPAVILCDIGMPDMDGYEVARRLKADPELATVPLVAVTAFAMVGDREKVMSAGFDAYLTKPIDPASLADSLAKWAAAASATVAVPPATAHASGSTPEMPPDDRPAAASGVILVLDDEHLNLQLKRDLLHPLGFEAITTDDVDEAYELALSARPDLILSDVGLNTAHGFDFLKRVKSCEALRSTPFIFLTATHWDATIRDQALALGADRFLYRPIEPQALVAEIRACLGVARPTS